MSEAYLETPESDDAPAEPLEGEEVDQGAEEGEGEEEGEEDGEGQQARRVDWEKRAHDKAGQAAKERSRRRAVERELVETRARIERLEAAQKGGQGDDLAELVAALRDDDDEPITDINQIKKVLKTFIERQQAETQAQGQQAETMRQIRTISTDMDGYEQDFASEHPDYFDAAAYYRAHRVAELEDLGFSGDRLMQKLAVEFFNFANDAMAGGRDPAEAVYALAKRRGFQSGKAAATKKLQKLQQANGSAPAPRGRGADNGLSWTDVAKLKGAARDKAFAQLRARELGKT